METIHARDSSGESFVVQEGTVVLTGGTGAAGDTVLLDETPTPAVAQDADSGRPRLSKFHAPEIVFGPDSLAEAAHAAARLGARRPFVVTDPGLTEAGWPTELLRHMRAAG